MGSGGGNLAAWICGANDLKVQSFILPRVLGDSDVKAAIKAVGICGSDVHYYKHLRCGDFEVKEPMVIGHECAGIIEEVGKGVKSLAVGDRVALEPGISCNKCKLCKSGHYNLCSDMKFFATPPVHGSLANYNVSLEEGAMCEPLSVGVHACNRATVGPNTKVLVLGAGPIGLVTLLSAHAFGSPRVVIADISAERLKVAQELGAHATVVLSTNDADMESEVVALQKAMGADIDVTIDCVGMTKSMSTAVKATRSGGSVSLVGMACIKMTLPLASAVQREVDIRGVFRYRNTYPLCLDLLGSGRIDVKPLITHRFAFNQKDVEDAFETSAKGGSAIKVMFNL